MATNATWTVVFDDKRIIKQQGDGAGAYDIVDDDFWGLSKWSNIWAIQYETSNPNDQVEYRDETPHSSWENANLGDFSDFINRWDAAHLTALQAAWDNDNVDDETEEEKIARLGARPTSYSSL
jgi:hypothetical protein